MRSQLTGDSEFSVFGKILMHRLGATLFEFNCLQLRDAQSPVEHLTLHKELVIVFDETTGCEIFN